MSCTSGTPATVVKVSKTPIAPALFELTQRGITFDEARDLIDLADRASCHLIPTDQYLAALRDSLLARLKTIPCFCTERRPELERAGWCAKHAMIDAVVTGTDWYSPPPPMSTDMSGRNADVTSDDDGADLDDMSDQMSLID